MELVEKWRGDTDAGESKSVGSHTSGHFNPGKDVRASVQCQKTLTACTKAPSSNLCYSFQLVQESLLLWSCCIFNAFYYVFIILFTKTAYPRLSACRQGFGLKLVCSFHCVLV